jgi:hypothetical protein
MLRRGGGHGCPMLRRGHGGLGGHGSWSGGHGLRRGACGGGGGGDPAAYQRLLQCGAPLGAVLQKLARDHGFDGSGLGADQLAAQASVAASLNLAAAAAQEADASPLAALLTAFMGPEGVAAAVAAAAAADRAVAQALTDQTSPATSTAASAAGAASAAASSSGAEALLELPVGARVALRGLQQRTDLNGSRGVVQQRLARHGCVLYTVQLDFRGRGAGRPEVVNVHAANVAALDAAAGEAAEAAAAAPTDLQRKATAGVAGVAGAAAPGGPAAAALAHLLGALAGGGVGGGGFKFGGSGHGGDGSHGFDQSSGQSGGKPAPPAQHFGVTCDRSGMSPIVGPRFCVLGANYDLCQAEFEKLPESERQLYVLIARPGAEPQPCLPEAAAAEAAAAEQDAATADPAPKEPKAAKPVAAAEVEVAADPAATAAGEKAPTPPVSPASAALMAASWVQIATDEPAPETLLSAKMDAPAAAEPAAEPVAAEPSVAESTNAIAEASAEATGVEFSAELAELRALGLVGGGPGGGSVARKLLKLHQGRLDVVVNALLDGN